MAGQPLGWIPTIHFLYVAPVLLLVSMAIAVSVSLATPPPPAAQVEPLTWTPAFFRRETEELRALPWYANYRVLSAIVLVFTAVVVAWWW